MSNGPTEAMGIYREAGNHDDILMTDMIGALVSDEMPKPSLVRKSTGNISFDDYTKNESSF